MDWIEWMWKVDEDVDVESGKWKVESGQWIVASGAVPDLTHAWSPNPKEVLEVLRL